MSGGFEVMIRWIAEDLAALIALIALSAFVAALLMIADGGAHSPFDRPGESTDRDA
jgi:hypothetical protein